jgi:lipopolysaccharide transport system permease protein
MTSVDGAPTVGAPQAHRHLTIIQPRRGRAPLEIGALWAYRELLYFLVWRDLKVRYRQTILGAAWVVLQPFATMVVFSVIFGRLAAVPSDGLPYPIFAFAALVPWTFFSTGVSQAANSLVGNQNLLKKVYFPRLVIPTAAVLTGLVDLAIAGTVLIGMMLVYGILPTPTIVWVAPLLVLAFVTSLGVGLWLSALNVRYRDVRSIVPFLLQIWLFATPIAYPSSLISEPWRTLSALNPMVGVVEGIRWALLDADTAPGPLIVVSFAVALVVLVGGAAYFRRVEGTFADIV